MILDTISNGKKYAALGEGFATVFDFLEKHDCAALETGRHDISEDVYVNVSRYETKDPAKIQYETHQRWIDVQVMVRGRERMGYAPFDAKTCADPYNEATDASLHPGMTGQDFIVPEGSFAAFFPQDAHKPSCFVDAPESVEKLVFKVRVKD